MQNTDNKINNQNNQKINQSSNTNQPFKNKTSFDPNRRNYRSNSNNQQEKKTDDFIEKVVKINRITKVTKGGRRFRFSAVVIVGNNKGKVSFATSKANEVPNAIKKAIKLAKKELLTVNIHNTTIPHNIIGEHCASRILLRPAKKGTGIIAGGTARALLEVSGIKDVYAKSLGSNNAINTIRATMNGLKQLRSIQEILSSREPIVFSNKTENKEIVDNNAVNTRPKIVKTI